MIYIHYPKWDPGLSHICEVIYNVIKNDVECQTIFDIQSDTIKDNDIYIVLLTQIHNILGNDIINKNIHIIAINTEPLAIQNSEHLKIKYLSLKSINKSYILDYQANNIKYFHKNISDPNLEIIYLPPSTNDYYQYLFKHHTIDNQFNGYKNIDVLFYGSLNHRRWVILNQLQNLGYNIMHIQCFASFEDQMLCIQRSKVVVSIFFYDDNKVFDFYRLSFLLANNVFLITESPSAVDIEIEKELTNYQNNIITADYDQMVNVIVKYLNIDQQERTALGIKAGEWFSSCFNFKKSLVELIDKIKIDNKINIVQSNINITRMAEDDNDEYKDKNCWACHGNYVDIIPPWDYPKHTCNHQINHLVVFGAGDMRLHLKELVKAGKIDDAYADAKKMINAIYYPWKDGDKFIASLIKNGS
jgi:hypothetical protein